MVDGTIAHARLWILLAYPLLYITEGNDVAGYYELVRTVLQNDSMRYALINNGMERTWQYSIPAAAASMANTLLKGFHHTKQHQP